MKREDCLGKILVDQTVSTNGRNKDVVNDAFEGNGPEGVGCVVESAVGVGAGHGVGKRAACKDGAGDENGLA